MSTTEGKSSPKLLTRRSAPHLVVDPLVGELIALEPIDSNKNESEQGLRDSKVSTGTPIDMRLILCFCG